jgi:hypothetical protein
MTTHLLRSSRLTGIMLILLFAAAAAAQDVVKVMSWGPAARMQSGRVDHCAVALDDGRVFVAGGTGAEGELKTAELYGPGDRFEAAAPMSAARSGHTCTKLIDGRVLVAGGAQGSAGAVAEIFNPVSGEWTAVPGAVSRRGATATPLFSGAVVLAGGTVAGQPTGLIELFNFDSGTISAATSRLLVGRAQHVALPLSDGRVLLTGGTDGRQVLQSSEIFDPAADAVAKAAPLNVARAGHRAVALPDGRLLIVGGNDGSADLDSAEVYYEDSGRMELLASGLWARVRDPFVTLIPGTGLVLIAGGETAGTAVPVSQVFEPSTNRFLPTGQLTAARTRIEGAALDDGVIFATGGRNAAGPSAACGILLSGPSLSFSSSGGETVGISGLRQPWFDPDRTVRVNGRGFAAGATITFSLRKPDGTSASSRLLLLSTRASSAGTFAVDIFRTTQLDVGSRFLVRASFLSSASTIADGTSNTIVIGENGSSVEAGFDVKVTLFVSPKLTAATIVAGQPVTAILSTSTAGNVNVGGITGNTVVTLGPLISVVSMNSTPPGADIKASLCCIGKPGTYSLSASYPGDAKYSPSGSPIFLNALTVVSNKAALSLSATSFPLFTDVPASVLVRAPVAGVPVPTGTVKVTHTTASPVEVSTITLSRDLRATVAGALGALPFKAKFLDKPNACFTLEYSGDSVYIPVAAQLCVPVTPALPVLEISAATDQYTFGTAFPITLKLTFPPDLGLASRVVHVTPPNIDFSLNVAVGTASLDVNLQLPFAEPSIAASYAGAGDVGGAKALFALRMLPAATTTTLDTLPAGASNPLTLRAVVRSVVPVGTTSTGAKPVPSGTVQFFDGDVILGQVAATANADGSTAAALANVSRPVGARAFRAVYAGAGQFAASTSPVLAVTIR